MAGRKVLLTELGELLGFDDGPEDLLEHLLTIDSREELFEYLKQLLGVEAKTAEKFVDDVGRFKRGDVVSAPAPATQSEAHSEDKPRVLPIEPQRMATARPLNPVKKTPAQPSRSKLAAVQSKPKKVPPPPRKKPTPAQKPKLKATANEFKPETEAPEKEKKAQIQKRALPRGKATYECGCFGNKHNALANCLYCGRISCEKEGYNFCPYCGFLVEQVKPPAGASTDEAWLHKERLLRYERESAQRTIILDDQEDYYNQSHSQWLNEEERTEAISREEERLDSLKRKPMKLDIAM